MVGTLLGAFFILNLIPVKGQSFKKVLLIFGTLLIIVLFSGNYSTPDQISYEIAYSSGRGLYFEPGYVIITNFFRTIGLSYAEFKFVICVLLFYLLGRVFRNIGASFWNKTLATWLVTSFAFETEQSRFFIAAIFVLCGLQQIAKDTVSKKNVVVFCATVLAASTIHTATIFYISFLFIPLAKKRWGKLFLYFLVSLAVVIMLISILNNNDWSAVGNFIYAITGNERIRMWFDFKTQLGYLECVYYQIVLFGLTCLSNRAVRKTNITLEEKKLCRLAKNVFLIMFLAMPLYMISTDFIRLLRCLFPLAYLSIWIGIRCARKTEKIYLVVGLLVFSLSFNLLKYQGFSPFSSEYFSPVWTSNEWL